MRTVTHFCLSLALLAGTSAGQRTFPEFDRAEEETVRLLPEVFDDLPSSVREELERRSCTIPQVYPGECHAWVYDWRRTEWPRQRRIDDIRLDNKYCRR